MSLKCANHRHHFRGNPFCRDSAAGAAINRKAETTQIQGIYNAEKTAARKSLATKREIVETLAVAQGTKEARSIDGMKEVELRGHGNLERFGMKTYEFTPGGSSIAGTSVPIRPGQELFDWSRNKHPIQEVNKQMDSTTRSNITLQNNNTGIVADTKVDASNVYQGEINQALETQAAQSKQAFNTGTSIASSSTRWPQ